MKIETDAQALVIHAPAKVNLYLRVCGKRPDGYHEIETLMCPIAWTDTVRIAPAPHSRIDFHLVSPAPGPSDNPFNRGDGTGVKSVPRGADNLVVRAAELVRELTGVTQGCEIHLHKRIPPMAGLGGGSSDAAATVVGCMALWNIWDRSLATEICTRLGSDVPFFLGDRHHISWAWATGRGEKVDVLHSVPRLHFNVTIPPLGCATAEVYAALQGTSSSDDAGKIFDACENGQYHKIGAALRNDLQFAASKINPWIRRQLDLLKQSGVRYCQMTGSGSSCFGLIDDDQQRVRLRELAAQHELDILDVPAWQADSVEKQLQRV
ncbi:MAG: hypothetical protein D6753_12005 [Planctomycetota bacterium]|nr:MAG: hypothetical protein D6753_12005 [Planctomycetota bacterium]